MEDQNPMSAASMLSDMFLSPYKYIPLDRRGSSEDDGAEDVQIRLNGRYDGLKILVKICVVVHLMLLAVGVVLWYTLHQQSLNRSLKQVSFYSPLLNRIEIPMTLRFDEPQTIRGGGGGGGDMTWGSQPNAEIDKMWKDITSEATITVTEADILALRKDPSVAVMLPEKYHHHGGEKTYLGHALIFHRLHCLDYIRKAVYKGYYYPNGTDDVPMHAEHVAHCIAMVLDHLTCAGDPGVYVYQWYEHTDIPLPDANTWGKCWDFKAFRQRFDRISLPDVNPFEISKPPGIKAVKEQNNLQEIIYQTRKGRPGHKA